MDKKAKEILFKTYWTAGGWRSIPAISADDFEYAKSKGLMFDPLTISKAELISQLNEIVKKIPLKTITDAFLCSLTNKRLDWRSGIASYANIRRLLNRPNTPEYLYGYGENEALSILNFERIKWGGVRHSYGLYNLLDLELLKKELVDLPTEKDIKLFQNILNTINNSSPADTPGKLRDNLKEIIKASKSETHILLEILGCAAIIVPSRYDRKEPGKHDWDFVLHWRGEDKYNKNNVKFYFGDYGIE